jgi:hypothetical protein
MKTLLIPMLACGIALAQTPPAPKKAAPDAKKAAPAAAAKAAPAAPKAAAAGAPNLLNPGSLKARAPEVYKVKFTTTKGDVIVQVNRVWAPWGRIFAIWCGAGSKDAAFFRIVPRFVAQFGIPRVGCGGGLGKPRFWTIMTQSTSADADLRDCRSQHAHYANLHQLQR